MTTEEAGPAPNADSAAASDPRVPDSAAIWWIRIGLLLLVILVAKQTLGSIDWSGLALRLRSADRIGVGWVLLALGFRLLVWDGRWRYGMRRLEVEATMSRTLPALLGGILLNTVTPTGRVAGGLFRVRHGARRSRGQSARVLGTVVVDQLLHQGVALVVSLGSLVLIAALSARWGAVLGVSVVVAAVLLLFLLGPRWGRTGLRRIGEWTQSRIERMGDRSRRVAALGRESIGTVKTGISSSGLVVGGVVYSLVMLVLLGGAVWLAAMALDIEVEWWRCLVAVTLASLAGGVVGTPGGAGGVEAGMVLTLTLLGVGREDAMATTLLFRALHYISVGGLGLPALLLCELRRTREATMGEVP